MKTTDLSAVCPRCFRKMKSAIDVFGDEEPVSGDLALCKACNSVSVFDFTRRNILRRPTAKETPEIKENASMARLKARRAERRTN